MGCKSLLRASPGVLQLGVACIPAGFFAQAPGPKLDSTRLYSTRTRFKLPRMVTIGEIARRRPGGIRISADVSGGAFPAQPGQRSVTPSRLGKPVAASGASLPREISHSGGTGWRGRVSATQRRQGRLHRSTLVKACLDALTPVSDRAGTIRLNALSQGTAVAVNRRTTRESLPGVRGAHG